MSTDSVADSVAAAVTRPDATDALISDEVKQQRQLEERLKQTETDLVAVEASLEAKADDLEKHTEAVAETQKQLRETKQQSNELMIQQRYLQSQIASHDATRMGHRNNLADTRVNLKYTDIKSLDRGLAELRSIKGKKDATAAEKKAAEREAMLLDAQRERVRAYQAHSTAENKSLEDASTTKKELEKLRKEITVLKRKETKLADKLGKNKSAVETEYNKLVKRRKKLTDTKRKIVQDLKNLQTEQTRIKRSEERKAKKAQKEQVKKEQGNDNAETKTDKTTKAATAAAPVAKKKSLYSVQKQNASILKTYLEGLKPKSSTPVAATPESKLVPAPSGRKSRNARFQGKAVVKAVRATEEKKDDTKNKKHGGASRKHHASRSLVITNHTSHYLSLFKNVGVEAPLELGEIESALAQLAARVEFFNNATTEESAPKEATVKSKSEHRTTLKEFMKEASEPPKDENTPQIKIIDPKEAEVDPNHLTYAEVEQSTH